MGEERSKAKNLSPVESEPSPNVPRDPNAIYQNGQSVGRVIDAEVDLDAKEIRFSEISNSDLLLLPDECEYQKYTILIRRIGYATKAHPTSPHKGRILKGVIADILGHRAQ